MKFDEVSEGDTFITNKGKTEVQVVEKLRSFLIVHAVDKWDNQTFVRLYYKVSKDKWNKVTIVEKVNREDFPNRLILEIFGNDVKITMGENHG